MLDIFVWINASSDPAPAALRLNSAVGC